MPSFCFLSDLHKFALRSTADRYEPEIRRIADEVDWCVLGGDIFDFRWSRLGSPTATAEAAIQWLTELSDDHRETEFRLLLGNHDHSDALTELLPELADSLPNFDWHHYYFRLGSSVFLHGDVADVPKRTLRSKQACQATRLERRRLRSRRHGRRPRGPASNQIYRAFLGTRLHRLVPRVAYPTRRVARRLANYLDGLNLAAADGIRDVYFGHTHLPVRDYVFAGLRFHNGGAPIGHDTFQVLRGRAEEDAIVAGH